MIAFGPVPSRRLGHSLGINNMPTKICIYSCVYCQLGRENNFAFTGNAEIDLLSITSVHPMRKDSVEKFLKKANANWDIVVKLINEDKLKEVKYKNKEFYMRKLDIHDS